MACGNGSTGSANTTGTVTTFLSDPPTCEAPNGPYSNVWVTITKVRAHISSNAGANDSNWVDLVNIESMPRQIDLLNLSDEDSTTCILNQLGSASGLPPGRYQQIRLHLLPTDASPGPAVNACENGGQVVGNNCVVMNGTAIPLQLSSQDETGIKIPPGQIAGGAINLQAGQPADINIEFNACSSVIIQSGERFRLKPTLLAGEFSGASLNSGENAIRGRVLVGEVAAGEVVTSDPPAPISGAIVLLEQPDGDNIGRVQRSGVTGSSGQFIFCPLPDDDGPFDVVIAASDGTTTYNATVTFSVPVGTNLGDIPLLPEGSGATPPTIEGEVTSDAPGGVTDVDVSPLQEATPMAMGASTINLTIPVFGATSQPPLLATSVGSLMYSLSVPASNPVVGTFDSGNLPTVYDEPAMTTPVPYSVNGKADSCTPASVTTANTVDVAGTPPVTVTADTIALTSCVD